MASILDKLAIRHAALPISVEQYHRLGEAGIIAENTELLQGVIIEKTVRTPLHSWLVQFLAGWLRAGLRDRFHVRQEQPLTFPDSEPEPDIAVVPGAADDYRLEHPREARLVIEVAIASVDLDREKANLYAACGVPEYWIVLADEKVVEVHTEPSSSGYERFERHTQGEVVSVRGLSDLDLDLSQLSSGR